MAKNILFFFFFPVFVFSATGDSTIYMVGNAHIDLAYRWRWNETTDRVGPDTFVGVLDILEKTPGLVYAQSQLALYESIEKTHPLIFQRICEMIKQKRWSVVGGQWAEPDCILPSGESFIRQFLIANEYCRKHLAVENIDIAWVPDSFCGQALTLPQIYSGCGIRYYLFGRGAPKDKRVFWWLAPDQSKVLAYYLPVPYGLTAPDADLLPPMREWYRLTDLPFAMLIFGEGDHGGGPRQDDIDAINVLKQKKNFPDLKYSSPEQFFALLNETKSEWPVFSGEIGLGIGEAGDLPGSFRGSYTSQAGLKKLHRGAENLLLTAEKFSAIGSLLQRKPLFPRVDFREAWKVLLRNQFHDILPGTSIADVFDDSKADLQHVQQEGKRLLRFGLEIIGSRIDTRGSGVPIVVYNPCSWTRSDIVKADVEFIEPCRQFIIKDANDRPIPYQILSQSEDYLHLTVLLAAENVPSVGYKVYRLFPGQKQIIPTDLQVSTNIMENRFFKICWDDQGITSILDKRQNREVTRGRPSSLQLLSESRSSAWDVVYSGQQIDLKVSERPKLLANGPVAAVLGWRCTTESSCFAVELHLAAGQPRVDFRMKVNWHEHDKMLKAVFPVNVAAGTAVFEQPYGQIERPLNGMDWAAQNWIDLSDQDFGVALLNDGKYGFDVQEGLLRMSVVRGGRDMDPRMDEGEHTFGYALYPHSGDWRQAQVTQRALEFNQPLLAMQENHHIGTLPDWSRKNDYSLGNEHSFFSVNSDHVIISAVKVQQGDWSPHNMVVRLFETTGRPANVTVTCAFTPAAVQAVNHIEDALPDACGLLLQKNGFVVPMKAHEIRTVLLKL